MRVRLRVWVKATVRVRVRFKVRTFARLAAASLPSLGTQSLAVPCRFQGVRVCELGSEG